MDLGVLAGALRRTRSRRRRVFASIATVIGVAILDALCARRMTLGEGTTARPPAAASWR